MIRTHAKGKAQESAPGERNPSKRAATPQLWPNQREDLRLAAAQMTGAARRAFQAEMTLKYCHGSARLAETLLGWSRDAVEVGLAERRTGIVCVGGHAAWSGRKRWEEKYPEAAEALRVVAEAHAQQDPTFRTTLAYTRLTAKAAGEALRAQGIAESHLPSPSTMAEVLNRMGYRLRKVLKAKPQKKIAETDAIFANLKKRPGHPRSQAVEYGL
jgi:Rhodopirellula transposase DDE domain